MMNKKILLIIMSIFTLGLSAQTITNYTTADGLISDFVECVDVDVNGNVWLGTSAGVQMFDGSSLAVYDSTNYPGMLSIGHTFQFERYTWSHVVIKPGSRSHQVHIFTPRSHQVHIFTLII